jgi:ribosome-associated protein
LFALSQ